MYFFPENLWKVLELQNRKWQIYWIVRFLFLHFRNIGNSEKGSETWQLHAYKIKFEAEKAFEGKWNFVFNDSDLE